MFSPKCVSRNCESPIFICVPATDLVKYLEWQRESEGVSECMSCVCVNEFCLETRVNQHARQVQLKQGHEEEQQGHEEEQEGHEEEQEEGAADLMFFLSIVSGAQRTLQIRAE